MTFKNTQQRVRKVTLGLPVCSKMASKPTFSTKVTLAVIWKINLQTDSWVSVGDTVFTFTYVWLAYFWLWVVTKVALLTFTVLLRCFWRLRARAWFSVKSRIRIFFQVLLTIWARIDAENCTNYTKSKKRGKSVKWVQNTWTRSYDLDSATT